MRFKSKRMRSRRLFSFLCIAIFIVIRCSCGEAGAIYDRVVAFVDTTAITLSELDERYSETVRVTPNVTREEVLETLINRTLLIREARKIRLRAGSEDELLKEYINLKIRAFVRIADDEIREFYDAHATEFGDRGLDVVREHIEDLLIERAVNDRLREHLSEIRAGACIRVQLTPEEQNTSSCPRCK